MSTLRVPTMLPTAMEDAMQLHEAFQRSESDTAARVVNILGHRTALQRSRIKLEYQTMYSEELYARLESKLKVDLKDAVLLWMLDLDTRDAKLLRKAFSGNPIDLEVATEVICFREPSEIQNIKTKYSELYCASLENEIRRTVACDDLKTLLLACISTTRSEDPMENSGLVQNDVKRLSDPGWGAALKDFIHIFSKRSPAHLHSVASAYQRQCGHSLEEAVSKKAREQIQIQTALSTMLYAENPGKYFARVLNRAMQRGDAGTLIRVIVTRVEVDMQHIKTNYRTIYTESLDDAVRSKTSGHRRAFLLSLLGSGDHDNQKKLIISILLFCLLACAVQKAKVS